MNLILLTAGITFATLLIGVPLLLGVARLLGIYAIVRERQCHVFVLFGKVIGILNEPGLWFLWGRLGWKALLVGWLGRCHVTDMRIDQAYLRSQPVNSEEGAPMGIGIWYEMYICDPVAYLFKNIDPRGSLAANVSNSTVRCLSNLPLSKMLISSMQNHGAPWFTHPTPKRARRSSRSIPAGLRMNARWPWPNRMRSTCTRYPPTVMLR